MPSPVEKSGCLSLPEITGIWIIQFQNFIISEIWKQKRGMISYFSPILKNHFKEKVSNTVAGRTLARHFPWPSLTPQYSSLPEWLDEGVCERLCRSSSSWARASTALPTLCWPEMITASEHHALWTDSHCQLHPFPSTAKLRRQQHSRGIRPNRQTKVFALPFSDLPSGFLFCYILKSVIFSRSWHSTYYLPGKCGGGGGK